jgi:hypothetical protein
MPAGKLSYARYIDVYNQSSAGGRSDWQVWADLREVGGVDTPPPPPPPPPPPW